MVEPALAYLHGVWITESKSLKIHIPGKGKKYDSYWFISILWNVADNPADKGKKWMEILVCYGISNRGHS